MNDNATPITPASTDFEQQKEELPETEDLPIEDYDKTVADSFPASDPPAY
ncbi:MAG: hypothetical protein M3Z14_06980 [Candidatus Eremiobacteraeota bacterium]|nr:hypothetical protein [Candidatus Eremiobacteraeota bacterium]